MPRLACRSCGSAVYTVAPIEALFPEERRCQRCGALMNSERRELERRTWIRRANPPGDPGPPDGVERRLGDRRLGQRRGGRGGPGQRQPVAGRSLAGSAWID